MAAKAYRHAGGMMATIPQRILEGHTPADYFDPTTQAAITQVVTSTTSFAAARNLMTRYLLVAAVFKHKGVIAFIAQDFRVTRNTLHRWLREYFPEFDLPKQS